MFPTLKEIFKATAWDVIVSLLKRTCKMMQNLKDYTNGDQDFLLDSPQRSRGTVVFAIEYGGAGGRTWRNGREES